MTTIDFNTFFEQNIEPITDETSYRIDDMGNNEATPEQVTTALNHIHNSINKKTQEKSTPQDTALATCILLQKGGTATGMKSSASCTFKTAKVTKKELNEACNSAKITPRKLARALSSKIANISLILDIPGNQSKNYRLDNPNCTSEDLVWASDFQTFNPECPEQIRNWLVTNYKRRFSKD